ncbi:hypothetical protein [Propionicimonas sp. T2.31MG-18]|uniref:hypothetical protein n=1 Tax=Propionicimonas sp. T2.31MG-18 TaxID=3157620 RepID=UPI00366CDAE8
MQTAQFEASVVAVVNALRAGSPMEDDRIELKRDWPDPEKARQLAGAANRVAGEYLTYIIGIDETGKTFPIGNVDPATWWSQMQAHFDEVSPQLVQQCAVHVSENEVVMALRFLSDRAPYVIKLANAGRSEREVPMRDGTRTRSAFRHELLRLLYEPSLVPTLYALEGRLSLSEPSVDPYSKTSSPMQMSFSARIYFECSRDAQVFMPHHQMSIELAGGGIERSLGEVFWFSPKELAGQHRGAILWPDGIELRGPGVAEINGVWQFPDLSIDDFAHTTVLHVRLSLAVAGTRAATLSMECGNRKVSELFGGKRSVSWSLAP